MGLIVFSIIGDQLFKMAMAGRSISSLCSLRATRSLVPQATRSFSTSTASANSNNKDIHTAKAWAEDDIRQARFVTAPKQTNERWAIDLVAQVPPKPVKTRVVACAGGPGALGHPIVYINLDKPGAHECIYCQQRFIKEDAHH